MSVAAFLCGRFYDLSAFKKKIPFQVSLSPFAEGALLEVDCHEKPTLIDSVHIACSAWPSFYTLVGKSV